LGRLFAIARFGGSFLHRPEVPYFIWFGKNQRSRVWSEPPNTANMMCDGDYLVFVHLHRLLPVCFTNAAFPRGGDEVSAEVYSGYHILNAADSALSPAGFPVD